MKRKITVLTLCALLFALCDSVDAQQPGKIFRIGFLDRSTGGSAVLRGRVPAGAEQTWMD